MTLTQRIASGSRERRLRQLRAELAVDQKLRLDFAANLIDGYIESDRVTDDAFVKAARDLHRLLDTDQQRTALYVLIATWKRDEDNEDRSVGQMGNHNRVMVDAHRRATPVWVDGSWTPGGSGDAA